MTVKKSGWAGAVPRMASRTRARKIWFQTSSEFFNNLLKALLKREQINAEIDEIRNSAKRAQVEIQSKAEQTSVELDHSARLAEKRRDIQQRETEFTYNKELNLDIKKQEIQAEIEKLALESQMKRVHSEIQLEIEKLRIKGALAEIVKTPEGQMAAFPEEVFKRFSKEIEAKMLRDSADMKRLDGLLGDVVGSRSSYVAGQLGALKKIIERQWNIALPDAPLGALPEPPNLDGEPKIPPTEVKSDGSVSGTGSTMAQPPNAL
jgi:hypothetical protein